MAKKKEPTQPLKPDPEFDKMRDNAYRVTADELRNFVERIERLHTEKAEIAEHIKEVKAEAKGQRVRHQGPAQDHQVAQEIRR